MSGRVLSSDVRLGGQTRDPRVWYQWLAIYLEHCRQTLSPDELDALASALHDAVANPASLSRRVSHHTAVESRFLIGFLAGVEDQARRRALITETAGLMRQVARRDAAAEPGSRSV